MFYIIVGILLALYYVFMAPKAVKGTINIILIGVAGALTLVFGGMGLVHLVKSPPEIFLGLVMTIFGIFVLREVILLSPKPKKSKVSKVEEVEV